MKKQYIDTPQFTTIKDVEDNNYSLSASQYKTFCIKNKNTLCVQDFLSRPLQREDLGNEVGSDAYVENSPYSFIKTKALQSETYLLDIDSESAPHIVPSAYIATTLQKGDLLISKDSNVGEIAILDKDYPNTMLCSGIYKLPVKKYKHYLLAFIKSDVFRQQIDFLVPRGSTIRHGKTKFLDCLIPMPNINKEHTIEYIELLMRAIIAKEIEIQRKYSVILEKIKQELETNQKGSAHQYTFPTINEILNTTRLDSSLYSAEFKQEEHLLDHYKNGVLSIDELGFGFIRGNNLALSVIGESIYSDAYHPGFYMLILPKNISKYGTLTKEEYLGNKQKLLTLKKGAIVFGAEGTFRSTVFIRDTDAITNFHGLTVYSKKNDVNKSIFVKLMLDYFREHKICKACATGGNGGSLSIEYWKYLKFPNFPAPIEEEIVSLYHNSTIVYDASTCNLNDFINYDAQFNVAAGIYELDSSMKHLKVKLEQAINDIADDIEVKIRF